MFLPEWRYDGADPGLRLFTLANSLLPEKRHADVFEIGGCDADWLARAKRCDPTLAGHGVDWRKCRQPGIRQGDVLTIPMPFAKDVVIALSAIEHIGLGHYEGDPLDPYGDIKTVQRVREWIAQRQGFFYFDVPYAPEGYFVKGTKCRVYDDQALRERFGPHEVLGYTLPSADGWIAKPERNCDATKPYYYVACLIRG